MIKPRERFFSEGQGYFGPRENPKTETHCNVWDWDQLRLIKVKGTAKLFPPDEDVEISVIAQFVDYLSPKVCAVTVDDDRLITGVSPDPKDDDTMVVPYLLRFSNHSPIAVQSSTRIWRCSNGCF